MDAKTLRMRVKNFLALNRISNTEFAERAGVSAAYVTSIKENIGFDVLKKIYEINPALSLPWLLWGDGAMYNNTNAELQKAREEVAQLSEKVAMLQKIVNLYERNEKAN